VDKNYKHKGEKSRYDDSDLKRDKLCHDKKQDMGSVAKNPTKLPGQMYTIARPHNESDFAGEER
jgi:hypothetical protein